MRILQFRKNNSPKDELLIGIAGILIVLFFWHLFTLIDIIDPRFLPQPFDVAKSIINLFIYQNFLKDIIHSVYRVLSGYFFAILFSIPLGIFLGCYTFFGALSMPVVSFFRFVPVSAFVPLLILWFGIGNTQKISLIFIGVAFYLLSFVIFHVKNVREEYIESAYTLGANRFDILLKVILPACSKQIYDSVRTLLGGGWTLIVLAELVAAESGVGKVIIDAQRFLHVDRLFAAIIIVGLIGYFSDYILKCIENKLFPWIAINQ